MNLKFECLVYELHALRTGHRVFLVLAVMWIITLQQQSNFAFYIQ